MNFHKGVCMKPDEFGVVCDRLNFECIIERVRQLEFGDNAIETVYFR